MAKKKQQRNADGESRQIERIVIPRWELRMHINGVKRHSLLYRDDKLHIQKEIHTPVGKDGYTMGKGKVYFFIDNDKREFRTEQELIKALVASAV